MGPSASRSGPTEAVGLNRARMPSRNPVLMLLVEAFRAYPSIAECPPSFHRLGLDLVMKCEQLYDAGPGAKAEVADDEAG